MKRAAKQYLRQVKKHLYCPRSLRREFLRQLEDDIFLFCAAQEQIDYAKLTEWFGHPKDVAADFFAETDPKAVSRFAYMRLKGAYLSLAVVLVLAISFVTVIGVDYFKTQQAKSRARVTETFVHPDGTVCERFWVRTNYRGNDVYWMYSSCTGYLHLTIKPDDFDEAEPYAVDVYINQDGTMEHWTFGQKHLAWIKVYEDE